jgi:probable phosphoglycerate mutase
MSRSAKIPPPAGARLFSEPHPASPPGVHIANIDGASRGNPGPASYAVVLRDPAGKVVLELAKKLGRETNNVAEYYALLAALDYAISHGITALRIRSDSELLVRQMQGRYKVRSPELKPLHERASKLARQLPYFTIEHVRREMNSDADALANVALDSGECASAAPRPESPASKFEPPPDQAAVMASGVPNSSTVAPTASHFVPRPLSRHSRLIRALFVRGVLVPSEPLDLPEGAQVVLELRTPREE